MARRSSIVPRTSSPVHGRETNETAHEHLCAFQRIACLEHLRRTTHCYRSAFYLGGHRGGAAPVGVVLSVLALSVLRWRCALRSRKRCARHVGTAAATTPPRPTDRDHAPRCRPPAPVIARVDDESVEGGRVGGIGHHVGRGHQCHDLQGHGVAAAARRRGHGPVCMAARSKDCAPRSGQPVADRRSLPRHRHRQGVRRQGVEVLQRQGPTRWRDPPACVRMASDGDGLLRPVHLGRGASAGAWREFGELGNGQFYDTSGPAAPPRPVQVQDVDGNGTLSGVVCLTSDGTAYGYCALLTSGGVDCWGFGQVGDLGDGQFYTSAQWLRHPGPGAWHRRQRPPLRRLEPGR